MTESADRRPAGFVHVDLDGLWTLAGCYGYDERDSFTNDPIFKYALSRLLEIFNDLNIKASFFISGRDLELPDKAEAIARIAAAGHELANHGYSHRIDLEEQSDTEIDDELARSCEAIERVAGKRPLGFRAAGYAAGDKMLAAVARARMRYDGSLLPTYWAPLLRFMAGRLRARVIRETKMARGGAGPTSKNQYGHGGSLTPYWHRVPGHKPVYRLPVAVSPLLRLPIHASIGMLIGEEFVRGGLRGLSRRGVPICYLLHGMDALGAEELAGRLPNALLTTSAFQVRLAKKLAFLRAMLTELTTLTKVQRADEWVAENEKRSVRP